MITKAGPTNLLEQLFKTSTTGLELKNIFQKLILIHSTLLPFFLVHLATDALGNF